MRERVNTVSMLGRAHSLLGFGILDGVTGYPEPKHCAVFSQMSLDGYA